MSDDREDKHLIRETSFSKEHNKYTYGDYVKWSDDKRYELIDGKPYLMSPGPARRHQEVSGYIFSQFYHYLSDKRCKVYYAPFDVRLPEGKEQDKDISTIVQPDIVVVCEIDKLDKSGCKGAPDLVVEIISPGSGKRDRKTKRDLYEKHGVREYWLVDYQEEVVEVYLLNNDSKYGKSNVYSDKDKVAVSIFSNFQIDLESVFQE